MTSLMLNTIFACAGIFFAGLFAGTEFTVRFGMRGPLDLLEESSHIIVRQGLIRTLRIIAPSFYFPALLFGVVSLLTGDSGTPFVLRLLGIMMLIIWLGVTFIGTVPINSAALEWRPEAPPSNFRFLVERWERLAIVRVVTSVFAFGFFLISEIIIVAS
ncbi:DUF1772 domain-containing protein [Paenibacillus sp. WQ 127069]|uniref:DUF1772 domain-containing protein n=1 Tax=Paenibacillus baimaensis TaxID=2982185 RepID=A0ABT2ULV1_9BACL|nr:DUF1772 domain-containing protein [Paenibacillus sp. WQ 127069]MCU6795623.1 DUF1772 domain-containing protein [Paenibacillus sp. WQ 127069]